jgi:hypothetical protein
MKSQKEESVESDPVDYKKAYRWNTAASAGKIIFEVGGITIASVNSGEA